MPPIVLLTDFGGQDHYVGVVKGVILGIAPQATIVDLSHCVPPYDLVAAQFLLTQSLPYFPAGTIYVVVIDPGVGGTRRPLALATQTACLVGPDNGVFTPLFPELQAVIELRNPAYWRTPQPSQTFHGRDIFAPVAAHRHQGVPLEQLGEPVAPSTLVATPLAPPIPTPTGWQGQIQYIDHFGNLITTIPAKAMIPGRRQQVQFRDQRIPGGECYGDVPVGECVALVGSHGYVEIACHQGNAAQVFGAKIGEEVVVIGSPHSDSGSGNH